MKKYIIPLLIPIVLATNAFAVPTLQLDIVGGIYDNSTDTIKATDNIFKLNALLVPDKNNVISDTYFLSAALLPQVTEITGGYSYGSFSINGSTYNVTSNMVFGTPPLDTLYPNLPGHSVFPTYYKEISFTFPTTDQYSPYNSEAYSGTTPTSGTGMYVTSFQIDLTGLNAGHGIHFDLYNENITKNEAYETQFAPFSHDAEGWKKSTPVPEPSTLLMLGAGLLGLGLYGRRRVQK